VSEAKSDVAKKKKSERDGFIAAMVVTSPCWFVIVGLILLVTDIVAKKPEQDRIQALREATCAQNGMVLLQDKYHPAVCAFKIDEAGRRIP
jgi:hypothetical protein